MAGATQTGKREITNENGKFSFSVKPTFSVEEDSATGKKLRKFAGIAYTGDVIPDHWFWGNVVFDLSSMAVPEKFAALVDHSPSQRAGYVTSSAVSDTEGFKVSGVLLSNPHGSSVAADSDEGFPWQMSVSIEPTIIEEVLLNGMTTVNGRSIHGPCAIFRNSKISEVSFTATGWDSNTSATAMSKGAPQNPPPSTGDTPMTPQEQAMLDAAQGQITTLTAANTELTGKMTALSEQLASFSKSKRESDVALLFSETGREFKADDAEAVELIAMPDASFAAAAKFSRSAFARAKPTQEASVANGFEHLFAHVATGGSETAPNATPASAGNLGKGLAANAKARSEAFAKRAG